MDVAFQDLLVDGRASRLAGAVADAPGRIGSIKPLPYPRMGKPLSSTNPIVVVLVEERLLDSLPVPAPSVAELDGRLLQFHEDLMADGFDARSVAVRMHPGPGHRDGEGVLALREVFQDLYASHPNFAGAVLVGSFPEAMLVRRFIWKKTGETVTLGGAEHKDVDLLFMVPQVIAERSDIVLSDLDGNWDQLYRRGPEQLESIRAIPDPSIGTWPVDGGLFISSTFERMTVEFEDFFWLQDDDYDVVSAPESGSLILRLRLTARNAECTASDLGAPNPLARPEIAVSRINARGVGLVPDPSFVDIHGKGLLDASGTPQSVETTTILTDVWRRDAGFERRLLIDYFDRNHRFRRGDYYFTSFRPAAIASDAFSGTGWNSAAGVAATLEKASTSFAAPVICQDATVLEFVEWMKQTAAIRAIVTHAGSQSTEFDAVDYTDDELEVAVGGTPWAWVKSGSGKTITYSPSFEEQGRDADFTLYRTMWENGTLAATAPSFLIHNGCHVNTPDGCRTSPYDSVAYGPKQEAESMLFYLNGLGIVSRAKEYRDWISPHVPVGLSTADARWGDGLERYFEVDGNDANLGLFENAVEAKRTYWWSLLGDWTLRLRYLPAAVAKWVELLTAIPPLLRKKWLVTDGFAVIKVVDDPELAERMVATIDRYGMTERYVVGEPGWEYYLADGAAPERGGEWRDEMVRVDPSALGVERRRSGWFVLSDDVAIAGFASALDAEALAELLRHHEATAVHWIGDRDQPAMTYFTTGR